MGIELDRGVTGEVKDALDEAAILVEDLEGEVAAPTKSPAITMEKSSRMVVAAGFRGRSRVKRMKMMLVERRCGGIGMMATATLVASL